MIDAPFSWGAFIAGSLCTLVGLYIYTLLTKLDDKPDDERAEASDHWEFISLPRIDGTGFIHEDFHYRTHDDH